MADVELTRSADDRRVHALAGVGTLRLEGWSSRKATAEADGGGTWRIARRSMWRQAMEATDAAGEVVGEYEPRGALRRGGLVRWAGRELELRPASRWRERYALADGDRELAAFDGKGWGKRPVKVTLDDADALQPGLVLFAAFVVRGLAEDAGSAAAAGASAGA
jgi:hypothetical protein